MDQDVIDEHFQVVNKYLGLGPNDFTAGANSLVDGDKDSQEVILNNSGDCAIKGHILKTYDLDQLRAIVLADTLLNATDMRTLSALYDKVDPALLTLLASGDVKRGSDKLDKPELLKLASLYVFGHSTIPPNVLETANRLLFPSKVTVYTGDTLTIGPDTRLVLEDNDPIILNFKHVRMAASAQIGVYGKASLFFGQLTVLPPAKDHEEKCDTTVYISGRPFDPDKAQTGELGATPDVGADGTPGEHKLDKATDTYICTWPPGDGAPGVAGLEGGKGIEGQPGRAIQPANIDIWYTEGDPTIVAQGGCGQSGGDGGTGGTGAAGGLGGYAPSGCMQAKNGISGPGGRGGEGGDGGDANLITEPVRVVKRSANLTVEARRGAGGAGGRAGPAGYSPDGNGSLGAAGRGKDGQDGATPLVFTVRD
ncbi:hypothetical protein [Yoonia maritima]|uniref:hypothetical protein n=1 Tax=Yoonia maritima TaxID=1435347 RepID=UPI000D0E5453|nr:hypothetical protein [Yoonia maritima]